MRALLAVVTASVLMVSGCGGGAPQLRLEELGITLGGVPYTPPHYFSTPLCSQDGDQEVTIMSVRATEVHGSGAGFAFAVDWPGGEDAEPSVGAAQVLPAAFEPAEGSTGTVRSCGAEENADLAVVFPEMDDQEIGVERIEVTYEIDGDTGTVTGDVDFVQCPLNEEPGSGSAGFCVGPSGG